MAATKAVVLPSGLDAMSKTPHIHHRPRVHKSERIPYWWSTCGCGHIKFYSTWKRAYVDALIHSERLN
jgi:hypothetical protein